uniref:Protein kinase domain-containing protein n=1 Tax=Heterorhabditis bacteriophora TaxID=37862 RepID=A0A1I7XFC5_HETBA
MKTSDLPYIRLNGGAIVDDEARAWPSVSDRLGLHKQGSVSCEVLTWTEDEMEEDENRHLAASQYTNITSHNFYSSPSTDSDVDASRDHSILTSALPSTNRESDGEVTDGEGVYSQQICISIGCDATEISANEISQPNGKEEIGRGACAIVYKVVYNNAFVALKHLRDDRKSQLSIDALKREAVVINRLRHPNIIQLLGVCLEQPFIGLVLELCEGRSLKTVCQKVANSFVSVRILVDWAAQIASAMTFLSQERLVHRDLKADNGMLKLSLHPILFLGLLYFKFTSFSVLVKECVCFCNLSVTTPTSPTQSIHLHDGIQADGSCQKCHGKALDRLTLKITDFGVTKKINIHDEKRQSLVGTYAWMAPEAYRFMRYSEASDIWSFGVVLWELLTRKEPYQDLVPITVAFLVSTQALELPIADNCPLKWKELMQRCWNVEPEERPTFAQLLNDFKEYREELEREGFSEEQEALVQRVQSDIARDLTEIYVKLGPDREDSNKQLREMYKKLYIEIKEQTASREAEIKPEVKERRKPKKKIGKNDISRPGPVRHVMTIQPNPDKNELRFIRFDPPASSGLPIVSPSEQQPSSGVFGTLPRREKNRLITEHRPLKANLSISSPNLNDIDLNGTVKGPLKRKDAIRKKRPGLHNEDNQEKPDRAVVELADQDGM